MLGVRDIELQTLLLELIDQDLGLAAHPLQGQHLSLGEEAGGGKEESPQIRMVRVEMEWGGGSDVK